MSSTRRSPARKKTPAHDFILIEGARQNNLRNLSLKLPLRKLIVITGVSGSGKSSLAFDTIYSEGQRRYVETFSSYTRQFLDRMDKPRVDRIEGIPPAIAIDQTNPVRTSRSTVGTMTELNDHLKLLFARASRLFCGNCGREVRRDTPESIADQLPAGRLLITFPITVPDNFSQEEVKDLLAQQGYTRIHRAEGSRLEVIQDRITAAGGESAEYRGAESAEYRGAESAEHRGARSAENRARIVEDLEAALKYGQGRVSARVLDAAGEPQEELRFSSDLHCAFCDIHYDDPSPNMFSFNSPLGACATCRGFGRTIGIDWGLVVPDDSKSLAGGAVRPWQTESFREIQADLMKFARARRVPTDVPWRDLAQEQRDWVIEGEGDWEKGVWYGAKRYFGWLESKSYRMHIRVLLSKYRAYTPCPTCKGARLKPEALLWRIGEQKLSLHDVMLLPIDRCLAMFMALTLPAPLDEATVMLLGEIRTRLRYLVDVGLGYLTLDRQSRTLSGGEVQRINLTTALGTSLVNALFVLDEPSVGLHPRDIGRLIGVLRRLRDAGNTIVVVEHDPDVIRAADLVLDMGPGAGERGGQIVFFGELTDLLKSSRSLTAQYLTGKKKVEARIAGAAAGGPRALARGSARTARPVGSVNHGGTLRIIGAAEHNLKDIDVDIPLGKLVCVTGVSGSGKSTLMQDVLYNALRALKHKPVDLPGKHRGIAGHELVGDVVLVDQSPIGRTARSNPVSYVGAFDSVRALFAAEPLARERGYTAGTFSFNSGNGRCPTCSGSGFEHIEMQFLSDVYLRCPDCNGRRFRQEVLDVQLFPPAGAGDTERTSSRSVADVLDMTVTEACEFFTGVPAVLAGLAPLSAVGLGYVSLGQPVPTLSGGEAQRLKLAGYLNEKSRPYGAGANGAGTLFLFDEPTTGLHFDDIATLLGAFRQLVAAGHSVVVIEHNLDVIRASDWIIDLGPEGGEEGGRVVCVGAPRQVAAAKESRTGAALRGAGLAAFQKIARDTGRGRAPVAGSRAGGGQQLPGVADNAIVIRHAREHNLKNIDVSIPRDVFSVITGVSGSGKSTIAFDILFAEGQRRYLESLNAYARQFVQPARRPDVDGVYGVPPTVAIEQRTSRGGRKSTVATLTEIYPFLRLLFVKLGVQHCPDCGVPIQPQTPDAIAAQVLRLFRGRRAMVLAPLVTARKGYYTDLAAWAAGKGFAHLRVDGELLPTAAWPRLDRFREHTLELPVGTEIVSPEREKSLRELLARGLEFGKGVIRVTGAGRAGAGRETVFSTRRACPRCGRSFEELDPRLFSYNSKHGWCPACYGTGLQLSGFDAEQTGEEIWWNDWWGGPEKVCPDCSGNRLRPEALAVKYRGRSIAEYARQPVEETERAMKALRLTGRESEIARDIVTEILSRLAFLRRVGLSYLSLDRSAPTLSGGEAQRIRLASQLGSNLRGVCYILDEPTIGLHARDNLVLLDTLRALREKGNTVIVVEHDEETIRRAEHLVDLGPGGGVHGGELVAQGSVAAIMRCRASLTGRFLKNPLRHPMNGAAVREAFAPDTSPSLRIRDARLHNLAGIDVAIPLGRLTCVTGVSGSGKSTLVREVLYGNLRHLLAMTRTRAAAARAKSSPVVLHGCGGIESWQSIGRVLEVDQTPIGSTPRSCPATYVGIWDDIRRLFAASNEARMRGYTASRFSFNVSGGRCDECEGQGMKKIEMSFLPDVSVPCDACNGKRFNAETLAVRFHDRSIAEVLAMSVEEAAEFFDFHPGIRHALDLLRQVGLGYLSLGQQSPSLSGGEAQRIKLVTELAKARVSTHAGPGRTSAVRSLYVLDEPTIGLHMADVEKLVRVLHSLVDAGNTVVIIEHNLDIVAEADWIVDLGPEGGDAGGRIVAEGTPAQVARVRSGSHTARFLSRLLAQRRAG